MAAVFTIPGSEVLLSFSIETDGWNPDPPTYLWEQVSGPVAADIETPTTLATNVTLPADIEGSYIFRLTVNDGGVSTSQTVLVSAMGEAELERFFHRQLFVSIGGIEYAANPADSSKFVLHNSFNVSENEDSANTASFKMWGYKPGLRSTVIARLVDPVTLDERRIFKGIILSDTRSFPENFEYGVQSCSCIDNTERLRRKRVSRTFKDESGTVIAEWLISQVPGLTAQVEPGLPTVEDFVLEKEKVADGLTNLAKKFGANWKADYYDNVFFGYTRPVETPEAITPDHKSVIGWTISRDTSQVVNRLEVGYNHSSSGGSITAISELVVEDDTLLNAVIGDPSGEGTQLKIMSSFVPVAYSPADQDDPTGPGTVQVYGQTFFYQRAEFLTFPLQLGIAGSGFLDAQPIDDPNGEMASSIGYFDEDLGEFVYYSSIQAYQYYFTIKTPKGETSWTYHISATLVKQNIGYRGDFSDVEYSRSIPLVKGISSIAKHLQEQDDSIREITKEIRSNGIPIPGWVDSRAQRPIDHNAVRVSLKNYRMADGWALNVYRTVKGGGESSTPVAYLVGTIEGGGEFIDTTSDENLVGGQLMPTEDTASPTRTTLMGLSSVMPSSWPPNGGSSGDLDDYSGGVSLLPEKVERRYFTLNRETSQTELAALSDDPDDDGVVEDSIFVDDAFTESAARPVGELYLDVYSPIQINVSYQTRDQKTAVGAILPVEMPDYTGQLKITSVSIGDFEGSALDGVPTVSPLYQVQAGSVRVSFEDLLARQIDSADSITASGVSSISGIAGSSGGGGNAPGPQGIQGPAGPTGAAGAVGPPGPATVAVGTTTTGAPGTDAAVANTGTSDDVVLAFTIPRGDQGVAGADGAIGPQGDPGADGATGPQGDPGPTGAAGTPALALHETPTGAINGVNTTFTFSAFIAGQIAVFLNGIRQKPGDDYTELSTTQIQFTVAPATGDTVYADLATIAAGGLPSVGTNGQVLTVVTGVPAWAAPSGGGGLVFLAARTAASSASLDFTSLLTATYDVYLFQLVAIKPAANATVLMRVSSNNGATWLSGANYEYVQRYANFIATTGVQQQVAKTSLEVAGVLDSAAAGADGEIKVFNPLATIPTHVRLDMTGKMNDANTYNLETLGRYNQATAINAVQFLLSTGNIASGVIRLYGYAKS